MKLSIYSASMPEYGLEETVHLVKEMGADGVEWRVSRPCPAEKPADYVHEGRYWVYNQSTVDKFKADALAPGLKKLADDAGLETVSLTSDTMLWEMEDAERVIKAAQIIGCPMVRICPPHYNGTKNYRVLYDEAVAQSKEIEKLAAKYDVRVCYETHMGNIIPSASAAYRFVQGSNPAHIGIIYDPGNMVFEGFEQHKLGLELLGEYLALVHIKNALWTQKDMAEDGSAVWVPAMSPMKKGFVSIRQLLLTLRELGYTGFLSIEDFTNEEDTITKLSGGLAYLRDIMN